MTTELNQYWNLALGIILLLTIIATVITLDYRKRAKEKDTTGLWHAVFLSSFMLVITLIAVLMSIFAQIQTSEASAKEIQALEKANKLIEEEVKRMPIREPDLRIEFEETVKDRIFGAHNFAESMIRPDGNVDGEYGGQTILVTVKNKGQMASKHVYIRFTTNWLHAFSAGDNIENILGGDSTQVRFIARLNTCTAGWEPEECNEEKVPSGISLLELHVNCEGCDVGEKRMVAHIPICIWKDAYEECKEFENEINPITIGKID